MSQATPERTLVEGDPLESATAALAFQRIAARRPDEVALQTLDGSQRYTWSELADKVRVVAAGLSAYGIGHGDTIGILLPNTVECHLIDYATTHLGAVPSAVFNSAPAQHIEHQFRVADVTDVAVVVTGQAFLMKVSEAIAALGDQVKRLIVVDDVPPQGASTLQDLEQAGDSDFDFDAAWQAVTAEDLAMLVYTSGTTGPPKGAQWLHRTVMSEVRALDAALPLPTDAIISFMPMAHAGGRITVQYMALAYGPTITVCPDIRQVLQVLPAIRPDTFFSFPRFWEKLQVGIETLIENEPADHRAALKKAVETGLVRTRAADASSNAAAAELAALEADYAEGREVLKPILAKVGLDQLLGLGDDIARLRKDPARWPELRTAIAGTFASKSRADWTAVFDGTDACGAPVLSLSEGAAHPHLAARRTFIDVAGVI